MTLGTLRVTGLRLTRPKPLLLLAYLAHEGPTDRQRLASLFFPEAADPRDALSTTLARLKGLVDRGSADDPRVNATAVADSQEFLAAACELDTSVALALYRGPFAQGFDTSLGPELEEWVLATRELLASIARDLYLQAARTVAAYGERSTAWVHARAAVRLTEAHTLDPAGTVVLLRELVEMQLLVPDAWWRALEQDAGDWRRSRTAAPLETPDAGRVDPSAHIGSVLGLRSADESNRGSSAHHV